MDNTREKLVELFLNAEQMIHIPYGMGTKQAERYVFEKMADHLIANGVTVQKWIPVTDRLPVNDYGNHWKERKYYLVRLQGDRIRVARYGYKEDDWWVDSHDCVLSKDRYTEVTHWMESPQPPKEG